MPYVVVDFVDRMDLAYAAADLVVCRAGANSVTEAAAVGLPAIFVPLPIGNGEQEHNARPGRRRRRRRCWSTTPTSPPTGSRATVPAAGRPTPTGWPRWAPPPRPLIPRDADEKLARIVLEVGPGSAG